MRGTERVLKFVERVAYLHLCLVLLKHVMLYLVDINGRPALFWKEMEKP